MRCEALRPDGTWDLTLAIPGVFMPPSVADEEGDRRDSGLGYKETWAVSREKPASLSILRFNRHVFVCSETTVEATCAR